MQTEKGTILGHEIPVHRIQYPEDEEMFRKWIVQQSQCSYPVGVDTETTGLDIYNEELRSVQFGGFDVGWVLHPDFADTIRHALFTLPSLVFQRASFDLQVLEHHLGIPMEDLWPRVWDTRILAHIVDPRGREEGGIGHRLEELIEHSIDPGAAVDIKGSMTRLAKKYKTTKAKVWSVVPIDDPEFVRYSGMDPVFTTWLFQILYEHHLRTTEIVTVGWEHDIARVCSLIEREGFRLDVAYAEDLRHELEMKEQHHGEVAAGLGVEKVNSTEQVADALEARGVTGFERTETGKRRVDKHLLNRLVSGGDELAVAVTEAKKAHKWRTTWVDTFLKTRDQHDRCHPTILSLRARTARMSITGIPAQTLPSNDCTVRRCFVPEPGETLISCDFKSQELRVLAALSGDETMFNALLNGEDLHRLTADASGVDRAVGKTTNFAYVYGSGAGNIAYQCGIPIETAKQVVQSFENTYPKVREYSKKLQRQAQQQGFITVNFDGKRRRLPVEPGKLYKALNYMVQCTARCITCQAILNLDEHGLTSRIKLPIHDEVILSVPTGKEQQAMGKVAGIMFQDFNGMPMPVEPKVLGPSWGHGYGATE